MVLGKAYPLRLEPEMEAAIRELTDKTILNKADVMRMALEGGLAAVDWAKFKKSQAKNLLGEFGREAEAQLNDNPGAANHPRAAKAVSYSKTKGRGSAKTKANPGGRALVEIASGALDPSASAPTKHRPISATPPTADSGAPSAKPRPPKGSKRTGVAPRAKP